MTLAIAAMAGVFTACENTPNTPVGPGTGGNEGDGGGEETGEVLTVAKLLDMTVPDKNAGTDKYWVEGYIVGSYNFNADPKYQIGTEQAVNSSLLLADDPENTDTYKVVSVQLAAGYFRDQLNLLDHPENYKKKVKLYGIVEKYCGINGMVKLEKVYLDGTEVVEPELEGLFTESFAEGQGDFTIVDVKITEPLTYVWSHDTKYKYMKASSYKDATYEAESWLISPAIDLTGKSNVNLTFEHAIGPNVDVDKNTMTVWFSSDYKEGQPSGANWTQANVTEWSAAKWNFVNVTLPVPAEMQGKANIRFAFKYATTTDGSTWEIKNLYVK